MHVICKSCGVTFISNYSKTLGFCHNCIHNNKIYVCAICGKEFKSKPKTVFIKGTITCKQCVIKQVCLERYGVTNPMKDKNIAHQSATQRMKCFDATRFKKKSIDTKIKHYGSIENYIHASNKKRAETNLKKYGVSFPQRLETTKQKAAQTCLDSYGVTSPGQSNIVKEKIKQTCLKKYGVDNPFKNKEIQEKIKQTNLKKYGVENPRQSKAVQEKQKQTCVERYDGIGFASKELKQKWEQTTLQRYGVNHHWKSENIREKIKQTWLKKYGVEYPAQSEEVQEKIKQTFLEKYGFDNPWKSTVVREKIKQTNIEKYGTEFPSQSEIVKEKTKQTMIQKYSSQHIGYKYTYKNVSFDSSWELAVWIWATETGKQIKREPIGLEYEFEGKKHTYYPDFDIDGQLVEVKGPQFFAKDGKMQNPYDHSQDALFEVKHQCGIKSGVQFWSKKEMQPVLDCMNEKHGKNWLIQFKK